MKTIGISDFKELVYARLDTPNAYVGKTLVLWDSTAAKYGIAYRIIKECCVNYNKTNPGNQVWFKWNGLNFIDDNNKEIQVCCERKDMYGFKEHGILFEAGDLFYDTKEDWLKFINTHQNKKGGISPNWALIACIQVEGTGIIEEDFADNCEICKLQPTMEEWVEWSSNSNNEEIIRLIIEYNGGNIQNFDYWERAMDALIFHLEIFGSIFQIPQDDFFCDLKSAILGFPAEDFWNFIHSKCD